MKGDEVVNADVDLALYSNNEHGFKFEYPKTFTELEDISDNILISLEKKREHNDQYINVHIRENYQIEGNATFQGRTANKYYYQELAPGKHLATLG